MQIGFFFDQSRCSGCFTCILACKQWHDGNTEPANWRWVTSCEKGEFPNVAVSFLSLTCCHCAKPACISVCPADAIHKRNQDGIVVVDREKCLGEDICRGQCRDACPYKAPQFNKGNNAKMEKCDLCLDRLSEGKSPICIAACPTRALAVGPLQELKGKYNGIQEAEGFLLHLELEPSIVFRRGRSSN